MNVCTSSFKWYSPITEINEKIHAWRTTYAQYCLTQLMFAQSRITLIICDPSRVTKNPFAIPIVIVKFLPGEQFPKGWGNLTRQSPLVQVLLNELKLPPSPPPFLISSPYDWDLFDYFLSKSWRITHRFIFHGSMLTSKNVNRSNNNRFFFTVFWVRVKVLKTRTQTVFCSRHASRSSKIDLYIVKNPTYTLQTLLYPLTLTVFLSVKYRLFT